MGVYDAAKDALKVAQQLDNVELVKKLLDVQRDALDLQEKYQTASRKIIVLEDEVKELKKTTTLEQEIGHQWLFDPANPSVKLCMVCATRDQFKSPLMSTSYASKYCNICKSNPE